MSKTEQDRRDDRYRLSVSLDGIAVGEKFLARDLAKAAKLYKADGDYDSNAAAGYLSTLRKSGVVDIGGRERSYFTKPSGKECVDWIHVYTKKADSMPKSRIENEEMPEQAGLFEEKPAAVAASVTPPAEKKRRRRRGKEPQLDIEELRGYVEAMLGLLGGTTEEETIEELEQKFPKGAIIFVGELKDVKKAVVVWSREMPSEAKLTAMRSVQGVIMDSMMTEAAKVVREEGK